MVMFSSFFSSHQSTPIFHFTIVPYVEANALSCYYNALDFSQNETYNNTTFANLVLTFRACTGFDGGFEVREAIRGAGHVKTAT